MLPIFVRMDAAGMVLYYQFSDRCQGSFVKNNVSVSVIRVRGNFWKKDVGQATVPAARHGVILYRGACPVE